MIPEMEADFFEFFLEQERWGLVLDDEWIVQQARSFIASMIAENVTESAAKLAKFKFSCRWLKAFEKRFKIRRARTVNVKMSLQVFLPIWKAWMTQWRHLLMCYVQQSPADRPLGFLDKVSLYNTDESPFFLTGWFKIANTSCAFENSIKGVRTTVDITKRWCSLVITLRADNFKESSSGFQSKRFPIALIFRGSGNGISQVELKKYDTRAEIFWQTKGWFDQQVAKSFMQLWVRRRFAGTKVLLVNNLNAHISDEFVKGVYEQSDTIVKSLPPNTTHFFQPVDQNVGVLLKNRMKEKFRDWWISKQDHFKSSGNEQVVSIGELRVKTAQYAAEAWDELHDAKYDNLITRSFDRSGISLPIDGSLDDTIIFAKQHKCFEEEYKV